MKCWLDIIRLPAHPPSTLPRRWTNYYKILTPEDPAMIDQHLLQIRMRHNRDDPVTETCYFPIQPVHDLDHVHELDPHIRWTTLVTRGHVLIQVLRLDSPADHEMCLYIPYMTPFRDTETSTTVIDITESDTETPNAGPILHCKRETATKSAGEFESASLPNSKPTPGGPLDQRADYTKHESDQETNTHSVCDSCHQSNTSDPDETSSTSSEETDSVRAMRAAGIPEPFRYILARINAPEYFTNVYLKRKNGQNFTYWVVVPHQIPHTTCTMITIVGRHVTIARLIATSVRYPRAYRRFLLANQTLGWTKLSEFDRWSWLKEPLPDAAHQEVIEKLFAPLNKYALKVHSNPIVP